MTAKLEQQENAQSQVASKRAPRNPKYLASYIGHGLQGFICAVLATPVGAALIITYCYCQYQRVEYQRFRDRRDTDWYNQGPGQRDAKPLVDDWPSRDIADFMLGAWVGVGVQILAGLYVAWRFLGG